jgi:hypothetical protein
MAGDGKGDDMNQNTRMGRDGKRDGRKNRNAPPAQPGRTTSKDAGEFGKEGTNKTIAEPKADGAPSEELGNTPHVGKSPYTRG